MNHNHLTSNKINNDMTFFNVIMVILILIKYQVIFFITAKS